MKVSELIQELQTMPQDAKIYIVRDCEGVPAISVDVDSEEEFVTIFDKTAEELLQDARNTQNVG